ncbi:MAG: peptide ABC transporter substrate-binding protein [bacterium]|nr:peptide ABC transporter substrate-binding protein [bacterium]MDI1337384.1 peptide ABC transporter substrate-binding protein [Lacunisphaera sp.]
MTTTPRVHWWIGLALLALGGLMAGVFLGPRRALAVIPRAPEDQNVLRVAYTQHLVPDPNRRSFPMAPGNQFILGLWEPLVECDPDTGEPLPAAAQSWEWSADRKVLTLKLRPDARWSNGDPVTAHDFVRGWSRLLRQTMAWAQNLFPLHNAEAYHRGQIKDLAAVGLHALDDLTLRLELDQIRSTLVAELADPLLAPLHASSAQVLADKAYFSNPAKLVTNGPFQLQSANDNGFRLQACPYYHGRTDVRLAGVQFIRTGSPSAAVLLLAAGAVDVVSPTPWEEMEMPTNRPVKRELELVLGVTTIDFNVTRGPLRDVRVRQALALALDRNSPVEKFNPGRMTPAWSMVPDMPGRPGLQLLKENADEARRLLAAAGYSGGKGFPVLDLSLPLWETSDPYPATWTEQWYRELGVKTHLVYEPGPVRSKRMTAEGDYDVFYGTLLATVPDAGDLMSGYLWPSEYSVNKWSDKEVVRLLTAANTKTGAEHLALLEKAERLIMAAVPSVPVMFEQRQSLLADEVRGWYQDPLARQSLRRLWLEPGPLHSNPNPDPRL